MRDVGLLLVRAPAGLLLAGHGAKKLFGWFGGAGPDDTGSAFASLGYPRGRSMALLAGATEVGAGLGLAAGALTPLAAAGTIGTMANAAVAAHGRNGLWSEEGGYEYPLVMATVAAGVATHGPGALSVDAALGRRGRAADGALAVALGLGTAAVALLSRHCGGGGAEAAAPDADEAAE